MKKLFITLGILVMSLSVFADNTFVVTVQVNCEYEYRDSHGNVMGRQSAPAQSQSFTICAESEGAAIREAISQCSSMCESSRGQYLGTATYGGEQCKKYLNRSVGTTSAKKFGEC